MAYDSDPKFLKKAQKLLLYIFTEFDRVCRELDIAYLAYGGTAIGAVRHQGFIPWDDDVDVAMTRPDHERFLREAPKILKDGFEIHTSRTEPGFHFMFTKLTLAGTQATSESNPGGEYGMPFAIDIFPLDVVPDDDQAFRSMCRKTWLWGRLLFVRGTPTPYLIGISGWRRTLIHTGTRLAHEILRLAHITPKFLQARWEKAARQFDGSPTGRWTDFSMRDPQNWIMSDDEMFPGLEMPFEQMTTFVAREYDAILSRTYGDYMTLPPEAERRNHDAVNVDFGPYTEIVNED